MSRINKNLINTPSIDPPPKMQRFIRRPGTLFEALRYW